MKPLIILGTGGSAYDLLDIIEAINEDRPTWRLAGFLDDTRPAGTSHLGLDVLGKLHDAPRFADHFFVNVIGSDRSFRNRAKILAGTGLAAERFATLIHPGACVSPRARVGLGSYVNYGACVAGGVRVGNQVSVGPGCIVGHDAVIDDFAMLAPGAVVSGFVHVGRCSYVGAAAAIRQHVRVGEKALVGMGAVVVRDVAAGSTVVGNPARPLRRPSDAQVSRAIADASDAAEAPPVIAERVG